MSTAPRTVRARRSRYVCTNCGSPARFQTAKDRRPRGDKHHDLCADCWAKASAEAPRGLVALEVVETVETVEAAPAAAPLALAPVDTAVVGAVAVVVAAPRREPVMPVEPPRELVVPATALVRRPLPTASAIGRAIACLASAVIATVRETTRASERGRKVHAFVDRARKVGREQALAEIRGDQKLYERCASIDLEALPEGAESEVACMWDLETDVVTRLDLTAHRAYPDVGDRLVLFGTFDLVGMIDPTTVYYDDEKNGTAETTAEESWQLAIGAVMLAKLTGATAARTGHQELGGDGKWYPDRTEYDELDLVVAEADVRALVDRIVAAQRAYEAGTSPEMHVGPWCGYCGSRRFCRAQVAQLQIAAEALVEMPSRDLIRERLSILPVEVKGELYEKVEVLLDLLGEVKSVLRDDARVEPLPLAGGKELREVRWGQLVKDAEAQRREQVLDDELRSEGHIYSMPTTQVRPMKARRRA